VGLLADQLVPHTLATIVALGYAAAAAASLLLPAIRTFAY